MPRVISCLNQTGTVFIQGAILTRKSHSFHYPVKWGWGVKETIQAFEQSVYLVPRPSRKGPTLNRGLQIQLSCSGSCLVFSINIQKSQLLTLSACQLHLSKRFMSDIWDKHYISYCQALNLATIVSLSLPIKTFPSNPQVTSLNRYCLNNKLRRNN